MGVSDITNTTIDAVMGALSDPDRYVVAQTAPAIRVSLGEEFGMPPGTIVTGKMHATLRRLGFDAVFETSFGADVAVIEEAQELVDILTGKSESPLPLFNSCCPGWVNFAEMSYPDLLDHISSVKSPQQIVGALIKTYYAEKAGIDPAKIVSVSIMPCTVKKFEASRPEMNASGFEDVDYVLTTREFAEMIKEAGIDFPSLSDEDADPTLGMYSGAGVIFGTTGGVTEAALRTAYKLITGKDMEDLEIKPVRGMEGVKEASFELKGETIRIAVVNGLAYARPLLEEVRSGKSPYHFIEVMACPGGCIGGAGQPISRDPGVKLARARALYVEDERRPFRTSHENPYVKELYREYLGGLMGERSRRLIHTAYTSRKK